MKQRNFDDDDTKWNEILERSRKFIHECYTITCAESSLAIDIWIFGRQMSHLTSGKIIGPMHVRCDAVAK